MAKRERVLVHRIDPTPQEWANAYFAATGADHVAVPEAEARARRQAARMTNTDADGYIKRGRVWAAREAASAADETETIVETIHGRDVAVEYTVITARSIRRHDRARRDALRAHRAWQRARRTSAGVHRGTRARGAGRPRASASRSSARSGDSGGDSDPAPADPAYLGLTSRQGSPVALYGTVADDGAALIAVPLSLTASRDDSPAARDAERRFALPKGGAR